MSAAAGHVAAVRRESRYPPPQGAPGFAILVGRCRLKSTSRREAVAIPVRRITARWWPGPWYLPSGGIFHWPHGRCVICFLLVPPCPQFADVLR